jgi:hypothetical protein
MRRCNTIEEAYEFMLACAAQGVSGDASSQSGGQIREFLTRAAAALTGLGDLYLSLVERESLEPSHYRPFGAVIDRDAHDSPGGDESGTRAGRDQFADRRQSQRVDSSSRLADRSVFDRRGPEIRVD